jgi:hypothetical protein
MPLPSGVPNAHTTAGPLEPPYSRRSHVETASGGRQVFGAVAKADTDIKALIRRSLDAAGRTEDTVLAAFTDGCSGLRRIFG